MTLFGIVGWAFIGAVIGYITPRRVRRAAELWLLSPANEDRRFWCAAAGVDGGAVVETARGRCALTVGKIVGTLYQNR